MKNVSDAVVGRFVHNGLGGGWAVETTRRNVSGRQGRETTRRNVSGRQGGETTRRVASTSL
jgi:hypothetical protein